MCNTNWAPVWHRSREGQAAPKDPPVGPDVLLLAALRRISSELDAKMHLAVINCILKSVKASKGAVISFYMKTRLHHKKIRRRNYGICKLLIRVQKRKCKTANNTAAQVQTNICSSWHNWFLSSSAGLMLQHNTVSYVNLISFKTVSPNSL